MVLQIGDPTSEGSQPLEIDIDRESERSTLRLSGELDIDAAAHLWRRLDDFEPTRTVTLDLSGVSFIDSSGLGCLYKLQQRVADAGGVLVATGASHAHRRLLETTGLNRLIAVLPGD